MKTLATSAFVAAWIITAAAAPAAAQDTQAPGRVPGGGFPRVEFGAGAGYLAVPNDPGEGLSLVTGRVGVALTRTWSVEGSVDFATEAFESDDVFGFYQVQALWRFHEGRHPGDLQMFLTVGAAGTFDHESWDEFRWTDEQGRVHVYPAGSDTHVDPPWYPTAGIGFQKALGAHAALRGELTVAGAISDDGVEFILVPRVSVSIPIGRYTPAKH